MEHSHCEFRGFLLSRPFMFHGVEGLNGGLAEHPLYNRVCTDHL
jgi:hypothetical protein